MKNIYDLKLHETLSISGFEITRVPGGWIYIKHYVSNAPNLICFVPFDNDLQEQSLNRPLGWNSEDNMTMGSI